MYTPPTNGHEMIINQLTKELQELKDAYNQLRKTYREVVYTFIPPKHVHNWLSKHGW